MPPPIVHGQPEQSIIQKLGMGAAMGGAVGMTLGFIFGGFSIISRGAGPRGSLNTLASYMLSSGGTFAFFMSIGSVIRTEDHHLYSISELHSARSFWKSNSTSNQISSKTKSNDPST
ncbi:reactive mitochondrial oxygen species modulator 1-domain-containing protein [Melampsora americana]|nr:reactive mitochondrial oxygen species modulator 1-domain-containing protein [Melampsora americana]